MFFLYLLFVYSAVDNESLSRVCNTTKNLHKRTKFRTLYELFGVAEKAKFADIKKKYRRMVLEEKFPNGIPIYDTERRIVTDAYDILMKYKDAYDHLLDNPYLMKEPIFSSKVSIFTTFLLGAALLVAIDFSVASAKILMHSSLTVKPKKERRKAKKNIKDHPSLSEMRIARLYRFLRQRMPSKSLQK